MAFNTSLPLSPPTIQNPPVAPHPGPRFADFQFRTIGQQPELLKRISAPDPDTHYHHDSGMLSPPSLSPVQSIQTPPPESDGVKRPSLRDRLSLLQAPAIRRDENLDVSMANPLENEPVFDSSSAHSIDVSPMTISTTLAHKHYVDSSAQVSSVSSRTGFPPNRSLEKEPDLSQEIVSLPPSVESRFPIITSSETEAPPIVQTSAQASGTSGISTPFSSGEAAHSLMALRTLQSRLSSSLSNFNPISTVDALAAAQSAKDQCTDILAAAHHAHTLAQQASLLAQDSLVAAQECLNVAATVQNRADLALSAVERIRSGQGIGSGEWEYNATINALKDDLQQLAEWVSQRDAYESKNLRQLEGRKIEKCKNKLTLQLEHELKKFSANKQSPHNLITRSEFSGMQIAIREAGVTTVEDEADAATRAWNQHREQSAERKRLAEDELRKRREAEAELERQRLQAQSQVDAREAELEKLRAARLKAEEEEKSRQEKETLELQRQQQELEIARFLRSQKQVQDDLAKVAAEEKKKAQVAEAEKEARLIAEQEQKRREIHEKELLKRQHDAEKAKRREMAENEAKRRDAIILERMKRLAAEAQQPPVSVDTVADILDKAKEKQSMATLTNPPSQHAPLPLPSSHQASSPSGVEFGNVVSKQTLLTKSPQSSKRTPGSIIVDKSTNSVNPTSSISSNPKSSVAMQKDAKSHEVTLNIPSPIDKRVSDSTNIRKSDGVSNKSDGVSNTGPSKSPALSSSPLTPVSEGDPLSLSPVPSSNDFEDVHSYHSDDPDVGNVSVLPPSRVLPVSLGAQCANLRPFMDANGITRDPGASDVNQQKAFSGSADQPSATHERSRRKPLSSSQMNGNQMCRTSSTNPGSVLKSEPDVPVLSMPSPPLAIIKVATTFAVPEAEAKAKLPDFKKIKRVPSTAAPETSLSSKEVLPSMSPLELFAQPPEPANSPIISKSKEKVRPAAVRRNVPPLTNNINEQSSTLTDASNQKIQTDESHLPVSPRMGPDAAVTDGWAQPMADDPMMKRQQKQLRSLDYSSPPRSIPPASRLVPKRPRGLPRITNDHYSPPRRIPISLPSHNDYARDRRRSVSAEYARGLSPQTKHNENGNASENIPTIGRKRYRDDDLVDAPPPRRHRYDSPPADHVQPSSYQPHDAGWSRYGRSPSPQPRLTPLALRLESETPWNSQGGSSYRPIYNDSNSYAYDAHQRYSASHSQSIPQGSSYYGSASAQSNQQRQIGRNEVTNDKRLPLLNRFTDLAEQTFNNHHGPTRPRMPRGRGGVNQALEQRISKPKPVSLINRLEDAN